MNSSLIRAISFGGVALVVVAALRANPTPIPDARPGEMLVMPAPAVTLYERVDTLDRGESMSTLLSRGGLAGLEVLNAFKEAADLDLRRIPAGIPVTFRGSTTDSLPHEVVVQLGIDRLVRLTRASGAWSGAEERLPWTTDTAVVSGEISSSLYAALDEGARDILGSRERAELAWSLADVFEYRMDMSRDLHKGDGFRVMFERATAPNGAVKMGRVLAASFTLSGKEHQAFRYESPRAVGTYFDQDGKSLKAAFLRAPLEFRRVSSNFGRRFHPVLKSWRDHRGTDYAASQGTPVRTIGDGQVIFAGRRGGYGNTIEVKHPNGYVTRYAHLRNFGKGVRRGSRVTIGQTVGYVGMTGLATGPHLHFEVLVGGVQRDPNVALRDKAGMPIPASDREAFQRHRTSLLAVLERVGPDTGVRVALGE